MGITQVPAYVPPDTTARLAALEAANVQRDYMDAARATVAGGGQLWVDQSYNITWTQRFITMGAGRATALALSGFFDITAPPTGTVIPRVGNTGSATVTAAGIPLGVWETLYYIVPFGSDYISRPANFRIAGYSTDFTVPSNWLAIATHNGDGVALGGPNTIKWCNGINQTPWKNMVLTNGWVAYGGAFPVPAFRKIGHVVYLKGLMRAGAGLGQFSTVPVSFRPSDQRIFIMGVDSYGTVVPRIDVTTTGTVLFVQGASAYVSLDQIFYPVDA